MLLKTLIVRDLGRPGLTCIFCSFCPSGGFEPDRVNLGSSLAVLTSRLLSRGLAILPCDTEGGILVNCDVGATEALAYERAAEVLDFGSWRGEARPLLVPLAAGMGRLLVVLDCGRVLRAAGLSLKDR